MFKILMDATTRSYYMEPNKVVFYAFENDPTSRIRKKNARLVETNFEEMKELKTNLYNAGFFGGYLDGKEIRLSKSDVQYLDRNKNEICFAQYLLTKEKKYLMDIKKEHLITLCKIEGNYIYFPMITFDSGETAVLAYTDKKRMPGELFEKYNGWRSVKMTFDARCIVNGLYIAE